MKENSISREVTSLKDNHDTFLFFDRTKKGFDYPLHFHPEYEINFIRNGKGIKRIVGDSIEPIDEFELCIVGPNLYHVWQNGESNRYTNKREITIQFVPSLFPEEMLERDIFQKISALLYNSCRGVKFSAQIAAEAEPLLDNIGKQKGFEAFLAFMRLLQYMAEAEGQQILSKSSFVFDHTAERDIRIERIHNFLSNNYDKRIRMCDAAEAVSMSCISFARLIKQRTGKNFIDWLNEIRLGFATRMMIDSDRNISEICFACGFNNISNFNRIFKKKQGLTPSEFRKSFQGVKTIV